MNESEFRIINITDHRAGRNLAGVESYLFIYVIMTDNCLFSLSNTTAAMPPSSQPSIAVHFSACHFLSQSVSLSVTQLS